MASVRRRISSRGAHRVRDRETGSSSEKPSSSAGTAYIDTELIPCLLTTVIDFQMQTRTCHATLFDIFRFTSPSNAELLRIWRRSFRISRTTTEKRTHGWRFSFAVTSCGLGWVCFVHWSGWTRRNEIEDLADLQQWTVTSNFKRDFEGQVRYRAEGRTYGLGLAVYSSLIMRLGVETVKPDIDFVSSWKRQLDER